MALIEIDGWPINSYVSHKQMVVAGENNVVISYPGMTHSDHQLYPSGKP